ncbi:MAG: SLC13 family permease [Akkermansia sp.]|nr:SLC13 family permease [Akkermansia sp.]
MSDTQSKILRAAIGLAAAGIVFLLPFESWGLALSPIEVRVIAMFVMAALFWILEPIPIWTTSVLVIAMCLLGLSSSGLTCLRVDNFSRPALEQVVDKVLPSNIETASKEAFKKALASKLEKTPKLDASKVCMIMSDQLMTSKFSEEVKKEATAKLYSTYNSKDAKAGLEKELVIANAMDSKSTMATFADPIIMLFLGGFFLAAAATKYRLDMNLAKVLLKPFGTNPKFVLLGLMAVTALFSMFMSNTATAAMMLAILAPVLALFAPEDKGRAAFALAIPIAANIGGIGTPIGTPPNAIALKALAGMEGVAEISFGKWLMFGVPFVTILILIAWVLLLWLFPISQKTLELKVGDKFLKTTKAIIVYITFAVTVLLWVTGKDVHGLDSNTIAMIPIAIFAITSVITKDDLKGMSWDVLWLVAGGFALGLALQDTGLAKNLIGAIPFDQWSPFLLMVGSGLICIFMATFMSHTATASLLIPIIAVVATNLGAGLDELGGPTALLVSVAFASSLGMALPISTPPNALAYATGLVDSKGMALTGVILGIIGMVLTYVMMMILAQCNVF